MVFIADDGAHLMIVDVDVEPGTTLRVGTPEVTATLP
jgi:hypothetical protein